MPPKTARPLLLESRLLVGDASVGCGHFGRVVVVFTAQREKSPFTPRPTRKFFPGVGTDTDKETGQASQQFAQTSEREQCLGCLAGFPSVSFHQPPSPVHGQAQIRHLNSPNSGGGAVVGPVASQGRVVLVPAAEH